MRSLPQTLRLVDPRIKTAGRWLPVHPGQPAAEQRIPQTGFRAYRQSRSLNIHVTQCLLRLLPMDQELTSMRRKALTFRRQSGTAAIAHKQATAELFFKAVESGSHGCLADMQTFGGGQQTAGAHDFQKG